ncbi:hypothetical protein FJY63_06785 [Candidatus Sumerlaeota bacterium]|nr:hypothetical protein [Candidatus Sumerlaeota bacterium]
MDNHNENPKTTLATAVALLLHATDVVADVMPTLDPTTARELAVLSRVLERRLRVARRGITRALWRNAESSLPDNRTIHALTPVPAFRSPEACFAAARG